MRILSLGVPLPGVALDNFSFASAPTIFDYDALVADPAALSQLIDDVAQGSEEHRTRAKEPVVAGPATAGQVELAALLRDRRDETARLLANGGLVVCLARPNAQGETFDRYCWLPAPEGIAYREPFLRRGDGTEIVPAEDGHPFAPLFSQWRGKLTYQAYFQDDAGGVIARSGGGAPVAIELAIGSGRIVFLPPLLRPAAGDQRYAYSEALQQGIGQMLRRASSSAPPGWVAGYVREGASDGPEAGLTPLLWEEGRHGLEEPVRAALARLGFRVTPTDIDRPATIHLDRRSALVEVEGSAEAVGMEAHYRLRRRLEDAIAAGRPARGLLVINGHRRQDPGARPQQHTQALGTAAETMRYCIVTSAQLFAVARDAADEDAVQRLRERLLTTEGVLEHEPAT